MWYEIIPSFGLVFGFLVAPSYIGLAMNKLFRNGHSNCRDWEEDPRDFMLFLRDQRLTGSEYIPKGLESIPDEPQN